MEQKKEKLNGSGALRARRRLVNKPPTDPKEQDKLADELLDWINKPDSYTLEEFPISKSMAPSRFYACANDNEYFEDALDLARYTISSRLQKGLRDKDLDKDYVLRLLPLYNPEYRTLMLDKIKQNKEDQKQIVVVMESVTNSSSVAEKR